MSLKEKEHWGNPRHTCTTDCGLNKPSEHQYANAKKLQMLKYSLIDELLHDVIPQ